MLARVRTNRSVASKTTSQSVHRISRKQYATTTGSQTVTPSTFIWTSSAVRPYLGMGTVPYEFSKQAVLRKQIAEVQADLVQLGLHKKYFTWAAQSDWFRLPFSKAEYFKVFEIKDENNVGHRHWFAGNLRVLRLAQDILREGKVSQRLFDEELEERAWALYKKFRFLATEQDSIFGYEDRNTDGLTQVRPTPYAGACLLPIAPTRVQFWGLPKHESLRWNFRSVVDYDLKAPAIDYFRAYVAAFDAIVQGRVPNLISLTDMEDKMMETGNKKKTTENPVAHFQAINAEFEARRKQRLQEMEAYFDAELKRY